MKFLTYLGATVGFSLLVLVEMLLTGWTISILWVWFIVATFKIAALTIPQSIGLAIIVSYLTKQYNDTEKSSDPIGAICRAVFLVFFKPLFALTVGWIVTRFM